MRKPETGLCSLGLLSVSATLELLSVPVPVLALQFLSSFTSTALAPAHLALLHSSWRQEVAHQASLWQVRLAQRN